MSIGMLVLVAVVAIGLLVALPSMSVPVVKARVDRFARRSALEITVENAGVVIRYLATTRRWRVSGVVIGSTIDVVWGLARDGAVTIGVTPWTLAGWFIGAVIAEWRVSSVSSGSHRAARLVPRRRADYLPLAIRRAPVVAAVFCVGVAVLVAAGGIANDQSVWAPLVGWLLATAGGLALVVGVQRHVLRRPQPALAGSSLAADEAVRVRSLRVLAGAAVAAASFPTAALIAELATAYPSFDAPSVTAMAFLFALAAFFIGVQIAISPVSRAKAPGGLVMAT